MSNPKGRALPNDFSMYFVMLAIYCLDVFAFQSDLTWFGNALFSSLFSFTVLFMYLKASKSSLRLLGFSKKKQKFVAGGVYGALFSLLPLLLVMLAEFIYYTVTDASAIHLTFSPPALDSVGTEGGISLVGVTVIYIVTTFFSSVFREFFFRGFMLKKLNKVTDFFRANLIQSLLYMSFILPPLARNFIRGYYNPTTSLLTVFIIIFYIVHETVTGIKWGLMTRVSGSTYIATVDHFLYVFLSNSIFITSGYETWAFMLRLLAIQLVSLAMVLVYYAVGMKRINAKKLKEKQEEEEAKQRKEAFRKEREANRVLKEKIEPLQEISPENFRKFASEAKRYRKDEKESYAPLESSVFIEEALQEKPTDKGTDSDVDDFLKKMTREMRRHEEPTRTDEITEDFDSDDFLKAYQRGKTYGHGHHRRHTGHSHGHHSDTKAETVQGTETPVESPIPTPLKKKLSKKPKRTLGQKIRSLGGVDDSSSNDLI